MEKIYNLTETQPLTEEVSSDFFDLQILTDGKDVEPKKLKRDNDNISVGCFVLLTDSKEMKVENGSFNLDILGNPMYQYVVRACPSVPACINFDEKEDDVLSKIKPYLKETEYSIVLYSDTPLITKANILNILDFVKTKGLNVCKLTRGWVFKNEYIKRVDEVYAPSTYYFEEEDFLMAVSYKQLHLISEILKNRIITYHMNNGVYFKSPDSTYIDSNVSIGEGSVIESFTSLTGDTNIGKNVFIGTQSVLKNAHIYDGAKIEGAYIDGGVIMEKATIKANAKILAQTAIKEGAVIEEDSIISNAIIGNHSMVGKNTLVNYLNCDENVVIGDNCKIIGLQAVPVNIMKGAKVLDVVTIMPGVVIKEDKTIEFGTTLNKEGNKNG